MINFNTRDTRADVRASERGRFRMIAQAAYSRWWGLDRSDPLDRAVEIVAMMDNAQRGSYLPGYATAAVEAQQRYLEEWKTNELLGISPMNNTARMEYHTVDRFIEALRAYLTVENAPLKVGDYIVHSANVEMNTALVIGGSLVQFAAKIHGWCEIHPWIEERNRHWFADLIDAGIESGIYRDVVPDVIQLASTGWHNVTALLRNTTEHPGEVVLSARLSEQFPNPEVSTIMPPWPDGVPERWDALNDQQQGERHAARAEFYSLDDDGRWTTAMDGIRLSRPWANMTPANLGTQMFGPPVTLFDLFHPYRDDRVRIAFEDDAADAVAEARAK